MRRALIVLTLVLAVSIAPLGTAAPAESETTRSHPEVVAAYPNPIASGDAGEYVVVSVPADPLAANTTLTDGAASVPLAGVEPGRVAVSRTPAAAREVTDLPVREAPGLRLANGGEGLSIRANGSTVHTVRYGEAPEGEIASWNGSAVSWRPLGATDRPVARAGGGEVRAFVLPDAAALPAGVLGAAEQRLWLAGYTLTSERVADRLVAAQRRGVDVRVLVEGAPVGGRTRAGAARLDRLAAAGVAVRAVAGPYARYDHHHAKYAVVDDRALVLTENWKPAGTGGNSSRGWGVVTDQPAVVENVSGTFAADATWRAAREWERYREGRTFERGEPAVGEYPRRHDPARVRVNSTELLVAPDNAGGRVRGLIAGSEDAVDVVQVTLGGWEDPFAVALRHAARGGVDVRVLLSGAWYVREDNRKLVERFRAWADRTDAPLSARLADPGGRYAKVHAKGAVVDDSVVLGSLNWNDHAAEHNRELVVVLHGREAAAYYRGVYEGDWRGGDGNPLPVGLLAGVGGAVALAGAVLARVEFET
jgi:hypothetical protein